MIVSVVGFAGDLGPRGDQARIAAQVVSGIGFLGAGTIMRQGSAVRGLTTAASLWVVAAIGLAVGIGMYVPAVFATGLVLASLFFLSGVEKLAARGRLGKHLRLRAVDQPGLLGRIGVALGDHGVTITGVTLSETTYLEAYKAETVAIELQVRVPADFNAGRLMEELLRLPGLLEVTWEGTDTGVCSLPR
jgi:putative Mg2+ transporter-C (MgtC) family protein